MCQRHCLISALPQRMVCAIPGKLGRLGSTGHLCAKEEAVLRQEEVQEQMSSEQHAPDQ